MKRMHVVFIAAVALVAVQALSDAQSGANFSGRWRFNVTKSDRGAGGNSPVVNFPSELAIKQTPGELHVDALTIRQAPVTAVYKFDGSEVRVATPAGVTETAKAVWDGAKFVIRSQRKFDIPGGVSVTDFVETWTVSGDVLTIEKSRTTEGVTDTLKAVFERIPS